MGDRLAAARDGADVAVNYRRNADAAAEVVAQTQTQTLAKEGRVHGIRTRGVADTTSSTRRHRSDA